MFLLFTLRDYVATVLQKKQERHLSKDTFVHYKFPKKHFPITMPEVIGELNRKSKNWYPADRRTYEGSRIESIPSHLGLHHLIKNLAHLLKRSDSCLNLVFREKINSLPKTFLKSFLEFTILDFFIFNY